MNEDLNSLFASFAGIIALAIFIALLRLAGSSEVIAALPSIR